MTIAMWKHGFDRLYKADAQKVAQEILAIGDDVTPEQILERARDEGTELHKCFEWDDTVAAEKYRLRQAGDVVRHLVIKRQDYEPKDSPQLRFFYKTDGSAGYKPTTIIYRNPDEYQLLLSRARAELHDFKRKYSMLTELEEILALID